MGRLWVAIALAAMTSGCTGSLGGDEGAAPGPSGPDYLPADGVTITEVAIYQGVERILMKDGAAPMGAPVIAGRDAIVRVFYTTDASYDGEPVVARLTLGDGPPLERAAPLGKPSKQESLGSTINFDVAGSLITPDTAFRVEILRSAAQSSGKNAGAVHPQEGRQTLGAVSTGAKLRVVLVPVRYKADGSNRLPDTSPAQLQIYRDALWRIYPVPQIDIRVADPFDWGGAVNGNGNGWVELLNAMTTYRKNAGAAFDEYYYGVFRATDKFEQFCAGTCLAGLSQIAPTPMQAWSRVGIGIGYSGASTGETAAHEIGHEHGRGHAPCGTNQGVDAAYPYKGGVTGVWGYDLVLKQLLPATSQDLMSYCSPKWVSDYNYAAFAIRLQAVNAMAELAGGATTRYERVSISGGKATWLEPLDLDVPPLGAPEPVHLETDAGPLDVQGHFFRLSHLDGGTVLFASPAARLRSVIVRSAPARR